MNPKRSRIPFWADYLNCVVPLLCFIVLFMFMAIGSPDWSAPYQR